MSSDGCEVPSVVVLAPCLTNGLPARPPTCGRCACQGAGRSEGTRCYIERFEHYVEVQRGAGAGGGGAGRREGREGGRRLLGTAWHIYVGGHIYVGEARGPL
jgi:hypothetical protein